MYTRQRADSVSGLYYYNARYSNPAAGRFIQPDSVVSNPYNPMSWDRYAYVNNNPINFSDPTGHNACEGSFYGCSKDRANTSNVNPGSLVYWKWAISSEYGNPHYSSDGTYLWGESLIGEINTDALLFSGKVDDPNWGAGSVNAIQHPSNDPEEQWGDIYANYVIGNIKDQALTNYVDGGSIGR